MSEANRTFGRVSGNIANPSKSENCEGNFRDLQKDLVVLLVLMLLLTSQACTCFALLNVKFAKQTLPASSPKRRAFLLAKIPLSVVLHKASPFRRGGCVCRRRGLRHPRAERDPSVVGVPLPRLFSPNTVEKRFDAAAVFVMPPYLTKISPLRSG